MRCHILVDHNSIFHVSLSKSAVNYLLFATLHAIKLKDKSFFVRFAYKNKNDVEFGYENENALNKVDIILKLIK